MSAAVVVHCENCGEEIAEDQTRCTYCAALVACSWCGDETEPRRITDDGRCRPCVDAAGTSWSDREGDDV